MSADDPTAGTGHNEEILFDFDREYSLADLLLPHSLNSVAAAVCDAFSTGMALMLPDGTDYYHRGILYSEIGGKISRAVRQGADRCGEIVSDKTPTMAVFPVRHEHETFGYIVSWSETPGVTNEKNISNAGQLLQNLIGFLMEARQKYMMTAGIHGRVVTESYEALQTKIDLLARSEEKYRLLSEQLEEEVARKTRQIQTAQARLLQHEKLAAVGQLAGGVAHEINNPLGFVRSNLSTIRGYLKDLCEIATIARRLSEFLISEEKMAAEVKNGNREFREFWKNVSAGGALEDADMVMTETLSGIDRIGAVVDHLKMFSAVDHPGVLSTDIRQCIDSAVSVLDAKVLDGISIERSYEEVPPVRCRRDELNQVFLNLLTNAIQAINESGTIRITVRPRENHRPFIEIGIADTGSGICPEHLNRIFEPFFTTRDVGQGMGLGLYAVYTIIRNLGGDIAVKSRQGEGTVFTLKIYTD